jgi:vacuolar-type H+-ATPase subunit D/Vma8
MPLIKEIRDRLIIEATKKVTEDPVFSEYIEEQKIKLRKMEETIERMQTEIEKTKRGV